MTERVWKIGELASLTGVSIRTLRHYDEIALLSPAGRSTAGHRLYGREEIGRLHRVLSLRQMGFSLDQICEMLENPGIDIPRMLKRHIAALKEQIASQQDLCARLEAIEAKREPGSADELIKAIEVMTMFEKYYTKEQLETLKRRAAELGDPHIRAVEAEWPKLIADVRREMEHGTDPKNQRMQALAKRWTELVNEFTGGDPGITQSLKSLYQNDPSVASQQSLDASVFDYLRRALI